LIEKFLSTNLETKYAWMEKIFLKVITIHPLNRLIVVNKEVGDMVAS
jgi:hypothetical protein